MTEETFVEKQEENLSIHIFSVSAGMVGVCFTVIGIINLISTLRRAETMADDITALDAALFLAACGLSYAAIKTRDRRLRLSLERLADTVFLGGLGFMVLICVFVVYKLI